MLDSQLIQTLGLVLVHFIWQGLLIGLLFGAGRLALKGGSAVARYNWAVLCLVLMSLAPMVTFAWLSAGPGQTTVTSLMVVSEGFQVGSAPVAGTPWFTLSAWLPAIVMFWLCGVAIMSARLGTGWWYLHQLRRHADYRIPPALRARLEQLAEQLNLARTISLAFSSQVAGPMLVGVIRPLILLPTGLVTGLSLRQLEMVLAHELAHLRRSDHLVNLFQNIVETLLFYHPVVRWVSDEIRAERELVSDAQAARLTGDPVSYAETLLHLEKVRTDRPTLAIGMADHQVLTRVRYLLAPKPRQYGSVVSGMALLTVLLVSISGALLTTGLKAFSDEDPAAVTQAATLIEPIAEPAAAVTRPESEPLPSNRADSLTDAPAAASASQAINPGTPSFTPSSPLNSQALTDSAATSGDLIEVESPDVKVETPAAPDEPAVIAQFEIDVEAPAPELPGIAATVADERTMADASSIVQPSPDRDLLMAAITPLPIADIRGGELLNSSVPVYPPRAVRHRRDGHAEVRLTVDRNGRVADAVVVEESPQGYGFGQAALDAVRKWRFEPFTRNGEAVRHEFQTGFDFNDPPRCDQVTGTRIARC